MKNASEHNLTKRLQRQLQSLRSIVPSRPNSRGRASVIMDALDYIEDMQKQIQDLDSYIQASVSQESSQSDGFQQDPLAIDRRQTLAVDVHVEVIATEAGLEVHLSCDKRTGLLVAITEVLEELGLAFARVDIQCQDHLKIDAFGAKNPEGVVIEAETVRKVLLRTIFEHGETRSIIFEHSAAASGA